MNAGSGMELVGTAQLPGHNKPVCCCNQVQNGLVTDLTFKYYLGLVKIPCVFKCLFLTREISFPIIGLVYVLKFARTC